MYSREEASSLKQEFWTAFGKYISPQLSADGLKINWVNYKTGIKHVYFKMEADKKQASISISISHPDTGIQELFYEQFAELKLVFEQTMGEEWAWEPLAAEANGRIESRIIKYLEHVNIYSKTCWPDLISFFKPRIILLDEFWSTAKYSFDVLK